MFRCKRLAAGVARVSSARALPRTCPPRLFPHDHEHPQVSSSSPSRWWLELFPHAWCHSQKRFLHGPNSLNHFFSQHSVQPALVFQPLFFCNQPSFSNQPFSAINPRFPTTSLPRTRTFPYNPARLRPLLRVSPPSPGLPRSFLTQNSFPSLFFCGVLAGVMGGKT